MLHMPNKEVQKSWRAAHLNDGVCPKTRADYSPAAFHGQPRQPQACWEALDWLSESNITSLAEAWDQCPNPAWLLWAVAWMEPDVADGRKCYELLRFISTLPDAPESFREAESDTELIESDPPFGKLYSTSIFVTAYFEEDCDWTGEPLEHPFMEVVVQKVRELWPNPWK